MRYGKYTCLSCGECFDKPFRWKERHGLDTPPYEEHSGCFYCGEAYTRTILCDACGQPITGNYVKICKTGARYCEDCYMALGLGDEDL